MEQSMLRGSVADLSHAARQIIAESDRTGRTLEGLSLVSQHLHELSGIMASIGRQTNLLSLNAGAEATRIGEAAQGFALITHELNELARQILAAAETATERSALLQASAEDATTGMAAVKERAQTLLRTVQAVAGLPS